jgi:transposase
MKGIVFKFRTGVPWRDLPERFGPWRTAHRCQSGLEERGLGRSRGGLTSKIHLACDGRGRSLAFTVPADTRNDCTQAETVIDAIRVARSGPGRPRRRPERVVADKGYSARSFRVYLRRRGIEATIPERVDQLAGRARRRERRRSLDKAVYRRRNVVERCFHRLKQRRGIATGYDKQPGRYSAAITPASTLPCRPDGSQ